MTKFSSRVSQKKQRFASALSIVLILLLAAACGPNEAEIEALVSTAVRSRLDEMPTATAYPTYTPANTHTPFPTYTPEPTATKYPTQTAYPTYTPFPTYTPQRTATKYPTHTAYPTYTLFPTATKTVVKSVTQTQAATPYPTYTALPTLTLYPTYTPFPTLESAVAWKIVTATKDTDILKADKKDGFYLVGEDIATGTWRIQDDQSYTKCYWKLTDRSNQIVRNYIGVAGGAFTIDDSILQLEIHNCGVAQYVGE